MSDFTDLHLFQDERLFIRFVGCRGYLLCKHLNLPIWLYHGGNGGSSIMALYFNLLIWCKFGTMIGAIVICLGIDYRSSGQYWQSFEWISIYLVPWCFLDGLL